MPCFNIELPTLVTFLYLAMSIYLQLENAVSACMWLDLIRVTLKLASASWYPLLLCNEFIDKN